MSLRRAAAFPRAPHCYLVPEHLLEGVAMDAKSHASQCLMEHQILQHVKDALRITLGWETGSVGLGRKMSSVQFTMQSLQRHLERVMNLEEENGYMVVVGEAKPNLHTWAVTLRNEHRELRDSLSRIVPRLESGNDRDRQRFDEVCQELGALLERIDRHDKQETDLLQTALYDDIGGEG
jgi:hypothetical protein